MFCMARIVCHLKFEAIATQSKPLSLRFAYPAPIQGSLCQEFVEDNNIKKCPAPSCGALNLADYLLSSAKYLMVLTIWLV